MPVRHISLNADSCPQALQLVDAMVEAGVRPDGATWQTLLSQSKYLGRLDLADLVSHILNCRSWRATLSMA